MTELTPTQRAIRVIVAQHLRGVPVERATAYAEKIHINTPLTHLGLTGGTYVAATLAIEAAYGFDLPDELWESAKTCADLATIVDRHIGAEVAA